MRRAGVLIRNLPDGSLLRQYMGGAAAWSPVERAIYLQGNRIEGMIVMANGGKKNQVPDMVQPPEEGWVAKAQARQEAIQARAERWVAAHED